MSVPLVVETLELPAALPHLSADDAAELKRLLRGVFRDDMGAANKWLTDRSDFFNCPPVDLLKRDELGVVRVISYLKSAA